MPDTNISLPYVFVADDAFKLTTNMMKPYSGMGYVFLHLCNFISSGANLTRVQRIYNYRLSRARRIIENCFGIMSARFRILLRTIEAQPQNVENIVKTTTVLHNFLRRQQPLQYTPPGSFDTDTTVGDWRQDAIHFAPLQRFGNNPNNEAKTVRDRYASYFSSHVGAVEWQDNIVDVGRL